MKTLAKEALSWTFLAVMFAYAYGYLAWPAAVGTFYIALSWISIIIFVVATAVLHTVIYEHSNLPKGTDKDKLFEALDNVPMWYFNLKIVITTWLLIMLAAPITAVFYLLIALITVKYLERLKDKLAKDK